MWFTFNLYSSLLLIGVFQGLIYATLMGIRGWKDDRKSDLIIAAILMTLSLYVSQWMLGFAGWYDDRDLRTTFMFYFPFALPFLLGPLLYCYLLSLSNRSFRVKEYWKHFIPAIMYFVLDIGIAFYDLIFNNLTLKNGLQFFGNTRGPIEEFLNTTSFLPLIVVNELANFHVIGYIIFTLITLQKYKAYLTSNFSNTDNINFSWLNSTLIILGFALITNLAKNYLSRFFDFSYVESWYFYLIISIAIFILSIQAYRIPEKAIAKLDFSPDDRDNSVKELDDSLSKNNELEPLKKKLENFVKEQNPHLDPELSIKQLADQLGTNTKYLSSIINNSYGQNFNDYINKMRVNSFKEKLNSGDHQQFTLLSIALSCGFNSKATFNRAFKKNEGKSPLQYLKSISTENMR